MLQYSDKLVSQSSQSSWSCRIFSSESLARLIAKSSKEINSFCMTALYFREASRPKGQGVTEFDENEQSNAVFVGVSGADGSVLVCVSARDKSCPAASH